MYLVYNDLYYRQVILETESCPSLFMEDLHIYHKDSLWLLYVSVTFLGMICNINSNTGGMVSKATHSDAILLEVCLIKKYIIMISKQQNVLIGFYI